jgi:hypothetical protein
MSATETASPAVSEVVTEALPALAEALYEHWRNSSGGYELKRQPAYKDTTATLKRVFADQAAALAPVVESIVKSAGAAHEAGDLFDSATWTKILDVTVSDPDGWDRKDFDASWSEKITREEFELRLGRSTHAANADLRKAGWDV